jgi:hypothetical protein
MHVRQVLQSGHHFYKNRIIARAVKAVEFPGKTGDLRAALTRQRLAFILLSSSLPKLRLTGRSNKDFRWQALQEETP